jgi:hypothetical protein
LGFPIGGGRLVADGEIHFSGDGVTVKFTDKVEGRRSILEGADDSEGDLAVVDFAFFYVDCGVVEAVGEGAGKFFTILLQDGGVGDGITASINGPLLGSCGIGGCGCGNRRSRSCEGGRGGWRGLGASDAIEREDH